MRGGGYVKDPHDLEKVVLGAHMGTPVLLRDIGAVRIGPAQRRGLADLDGQGEVVGGVVVARSGTNALQVIDAVKARIQEIQTTLPEGVRIVPTYDRSTLIRASIDTLKHTLIEEVGRPCFFSLLVITVGFLPVFTLEGTEGRLFSPLAWTKTFSMAFAAVLSVTLVPAIATTFIRGHIRSEERNPISRILARVYDPVCRFALRFRWPVIGGAVALIIVTLAIVGLLGSEFMP